MISVDLKQNKNFLILLFCFSFFINLLFFKFFLVPNKDYLRGDSSFYVLVAQDALKLKDVSSYQGVSTYIRVPGYSLFLAGCFGIFDCDLEKSLLIQIFLAALVSVLVFFLSLTFFPSNILLAKISSFLMAINFSTILYAGFVMSEVLFMVFFLMFSILFFSNLDLFFCKANNRSFLYKKMFFAGVFLGIASLIRPVGHFIVIISIFVLFFSSLLLTQKFKGSLLLFSGWFLIVSLWLLRNFALTGEVFFNSMPGLHFMCLLGSDVYSKATGCSYLESRNKITDEFRQAVLKKENELGKKLNDIQQCKIAEYIAFKYCIKYPIQTIQMCFINIFKTMFGFHSSVLVSRYSSNFPSYDTHTSLWTKIKGYLFPKIHNKFLTILIYYEIIFLIILYLGFCGCFFYSFFDKKLLCEILKVLPMITLLILLTFGSGVARLRFPVEPFLIIFAGYFWIGLFKKEFK